MHMDPLERLIIIEWPDLMRCFFWYIVSYDHHFSAFRCKNCINQSTGQLKVIGVIYGWMWILLQASSRKGFGFSMLILHLF